jgi:hypothetical protein
MFPGALFTAMPTPSGFRLNAGVTCALASNHHRSHPAPTAGEVVRAIQLYARLDDEGRIIEVPKTQRIVISRDGGQPEISAANPAQIGQHATSNPQLMAPEEPLLPQEPGLTLQIQLNSPENTHADAGILVTMRPSQLDNSKRTESGLTH